MSVNEAEASRVAERLLSALPRRWSHVQAVASRAAEVEGSFGQEGPTLVAAAWLHDVGYAPDVVDTGFHPLDGARHLRTLGVDERVTALVAHHSAATLEADLRGLADELAGEFEREESPVADALWYCDMTTGPDGQWMATEQRFAEIKARYGPDHLVTKFITVAAPDLLAAVHRTEQRLREFTTQPS